MTEVAVNSVRSARVMVMSADSALVEPLRTALPEIEWRDLAAAGTAGAGGHPALLLQTAPTTELVVESAKGPCRPGIADPALLVGALRAQGMPVGPVVARPGPVSPAPIVLTGPAGDLDWLPGLCLALRGWLGSRGDRSLIKASPRSACAGVDRAIEIVRRALQRFGRPVYVRRQIVHNEHVVSTLTDEGAVFVNEVEDVPEGALVIFSAHGVSPAVRESATRRGLRTIDATCPLVAKVHSEARDHARRGSTIIYIGHQNHEESEGTLGEAPGAMQVVENVDDVHRLKVDDASQVAYITQTTLSADETEAVVESVRNRFPLARGPRGSDICYATTNRQRAAGQVAADTDLVLVIGSATSSNAQRLVETVERAGTPALLIDGLEDLDPRHLHDVARIGITSAASTPDHLVDEVVRGLATLGETAITERHVVDEEMSFTLPPEVR